MPVGQGRSATDSLTTREGVLEAVHSVDLKGN